MFDDIWAVYQEQDSFAAVERVCRQEDPAEAMALFAELVRRCYQEKRNLAATLAFGRAGIQHGLALAAAAATLEDAADLRGRAKALAYNVGSSAWPGWDEDGIAVSAGDLAVGLDAARTNLRLAHELGRGDLPLSRAHWLLGAHHLARGELEAAGAHFEVAIERAQAAGEIGDELLNRGYLGLTGVLADPDDPGAQRALADVREPLSQLEYGAFFVGQLDSARRVLEARLATP